MGTVEIRTLTTDEWALLRDVRFASLRDAPEAFTSTVEREQDYPPDVWQLRTGTSAIAFVDGYGRIPHTEAEREAAISSLREAILEEPW